MRNKTLIGAALSAYVLISGCPVLAAASPSASPDQASVMSFGTDPSMDTLFGTWVPALIADGPVGNKAVVRGQNFYLALDGGGRAIGAHEHDVPPADREWSDWYYSLNHALLQSFAGDVPGQAQVILQVTPDGRVTLVKEIAFVPGLDKTDHFDMSDQTHAAFMKGVNQCLTTVSGTPGSSGKVPSFPAATAGAPQFKTATFIATFSADKDLEASIPDLIVFAAVPKNEKSQWTARICMILDAGFLYTESDALRVRLPGPSQRRFIPTGIRHTLHSTNYGPGSGGVTWLAGGKGCDHEASEALVASLQSYLDSGRYIQAEEMAKAVLRDNALFRLHKRDIARIQSVVEDATKKGFFEMDRKNTPHPPEGATPDFI